MGSGCERKRDVISLRIAVRPDYEMIAFVAGPNAPGTFWPDPDKSKVYILDISNNRVIDVDLPDKMSVGMSIGWRMGREPAELYVTAKTRREPLERKLLRIVLKENEPFIEQCKCKMNFLNSDGALSWSPDGNNLVIACLTRLVFSFDGCETLIETELGGFAPENPVWTSNECVYAKEDDALLEIALTNESIGLKRTVASGTKNIHVFGTMDGEAVYSIDTRIYRGETLFLEYDKPVRFGFTNEYYAALQVKTDKGEDYILVLDQKGNQLRKKNVQEGWYLAGISPSRNLVYLLANLSSIYQYDFEDDTVTKIFDHAP